MTTGKSVTVTVQIAIVDNVVTYVYAKFGDDRL